MAPLPIKTEPFLAHKETNNDKDWRSSSINANEDSLTDGDRRGSK